MSASESDGHKKELDGTILADAYRVSKEVLGEGASATVYKGFDTVNKAAVAIKIYNSSSEKAQENFRKTVEVLTAIQGSARKRDFLRRSYSCDQDLVFESFTKELSATASLDLNSVMKHIELKHCFVQLVDHSHDSEGKPGVDEESGLMWIIQELGDISLENELERVSKTGQQAWSADELKDLLWSLVFITWGLHSVGYVHLDIKPLNIVRFLPTTAEADVSTVEPHSPKSPKSPVDPKSPASPRSPVLGPASPPSERELVRGKSVKSAKSAKSTQSTRSTQRLGEWKLIDLDSAVQSKKDISLAPGTSLFTPVYMPPEVAEAICTEMPSVTASRIMDVWSVGMCFTQAVFNEPIFEKNCAEWQNSTGSDAKFLEWLADFDSGAVVTGEVKARLESIDPDICDLLSNMLVKNPVERFDIARCLTHDCFKSHRANTLQNHQMFKTRTEKDDKLAKMSSKVFLTRGGKYALKKSSACTVM